MIVTSYIKMLAVNSLFFVSFAFHLYDIDVNRDHLRDHPDCGTHDEVGIDFESTTQEIISILMFSIVFESSMRI